MFEVLPYFSVNQIGFGYVPPWLAVLVIVVLTLFCFSCLLFNIIRFIRYRKYPYGMQTKSGLKTKFSTMERLQPSILNDFDFIFCPFCGTKNLLQDYFDKKPINFFCNSCERNLKVFLNPDDQSPSSLKRYSTCGSVNTSSAMFCIVCGYKDSK